MQNQGLERDGPLPELLGDRYREILGVLISDYILTSCPVGSRQISKKIGRRLSPATIRNVMSDLEELGYLSQPHTSAGRLPTEKGLRYYVDTLIEKRDLNEEKKLEIQNHYKMGEKDVGSLLRKTSKVLASLSQYAGLVLMPRWEKMTFKHMEFLPLSRGRLLGIFVSQHGMVENRILEISEELNYSEIEKINNYCNARFVGLTLEEAREKISKELNKAHQQYDRLLARALLLSQELMQGIQTKELVMEGESQLLNSPAFSTIDEVKNLMQSLEEKQQLLTLLDSCLESAGVRIFIGAQSESAPVKNLSLVTSPYGAGDRVVGTLGVIGPTSMNYSQVIPMVDFTAKLLSDFLEDQTHDGRF